MSDLLRLLRLFRPHRWWLAGGIALNVVVVLSNVALLALSGWFIAAMAVSGLGGPPIEYFAPAAAIRGLAVLRTVGRYVERLVTHEATLRLLSRLRPWFFERLEPLAPARLQRHRGGDLLSRIRADVDGLDGFYLRVLAPTVAAALASALLLGFAARLDPRIALVQAGGLLAAGVALPLLARRLGRAPGAHVVALRASLRVAVAERVRGLGELLVGDAEEPQAAAIAGLGWALAAAQRRQNRIDALSGALSGLVAQLTMWGALLVAVPLVRAGALSGPDLAMVALFVLAGFEAVGPLPLAFASLGETLAAARRIFALVDAAPAVTEPAHPAPAPTRHDLRVRGLRMRHDDGTPWALDGVDLDVPQGGALGIVGPNGAGKTSLLDVLLRFREHQEGSVSIGGVSLRDLGGERVRALCGVVAQRTHLFNASIRDNLLLARPGADDAALLDALEDARLRAEVLAMPEGLDTMVGENATRLSGGQARRLAIARALLKDAPILILDEPTEGLDAPAERAVLAALRTLMRGRTTLLVTHRPQALRHVDAVGRFDHGRVEMLRAWPGARADADAGAA